MNLELWLQLRREGRLAAMPLGMSVAMAAFGDICSIGIINDDDDGCGRGWTFPEIGSGYGDGFVGSRGDGYGDGRRYPVYVTNKDVAEDYIYGDGDWIDYQGNGIGYGDHLDGNLLYLLVIEEIIQR